MILNKDSMMHLDCRVVNCNAEFWFNDIPIRYCQHETEQFFTTVAHKFLVDGSNSLEVVVQPNHSPSTSKESYECSPLRKLSQASVEFKLVQYAVGATPGNGDGTNVLARIIWHGNDDSDMDTLPVILQQQVTLPRFFDTWCWQKASTINLEKDKNDLVKEVERIHHLFAQGNGAQMADVCGPYIADMGNSLPMYGEQLYRQDMIDSVNGNQGRKNWVKPLDKEILDLRLCANGRLVQLIDKDWKPSIRTLPTSSGEKYPFPVFIGKYSGKYWVMA